ncbi:HNH endonuclease [Candidatus Kaiserbacteria bacterium]|nr:HNH endonuclease [Candidatus Kaiserbacteria bacterium]
MAKRKYNQSAEQKKRRAQRNTARRRMEKEGKVRKGDGKDVDHKKHKARGKLNNSRSNLRVMDRSTNRAKNLGTGGRKKGK